MVKAYGITPRHIMSFALVLLLCATAQADDYVVVVGSYANDNNAQKAQIRVANYLRQSGMAAQAHRRVPALNANHRATDDLRLSCSPRSGRNTNGSKSCTECSI